MRHLRALMLGIALIALVVACSGYIVLNEIVSPAAAEGQPVEITIEPGDTTSAIATKLRAANVIRQPVFFIALVRLKDLDGQLQAGRYVLSPTMTMSDMLAALQNSRVEEIQVTIPEGLRLEEIAERIGETGVVSAEEFLAAARNSTAFKDQYFLLNSLPADASLEGYLFPDTYRIAETASVTEVITLMLDNFNEQYSSLERDVRVADVNVHQIVTMASVVQREAALVEEMPQIAAVFWNRLKPENADETGGGKLQADATVQYALGYSLAEQTWWRKDLTVDDLQIASPYNTREQVGLPPGPISNPGLAALRAAAQPDESANYLYFVADCAKDGSHNFATTFAEFQSYEAEFLACN
jgi:UPF0755 protein